MAGSNSARAVPLSGTGGAAAASVIEAVAGERCVGQLGIAARGGEVSLL